MVTGMHDYHDHRQENKKGLSIALFITAAVMLLEFFGGLMTNSLALLSDSGHMLSDSSSLFLSLIAIWLGSKPPSSQKTFGYYRFEILAALLNGITLFFIAGYIVWSAFGRFLEPPVVASLPMIKIAVVGLLANVGSAFVLSRKGDVKENVNVRSAYFHIIGDALGSLGAITAGMLMLLFSWYLADPIISVVVALLIVKSAWDVINHTVHILLEGTPQTINFEEVQETLRSIEGVVNVHDLHVWTITSGLDSLSCHLLIGDDADPQAILKETITKIKERFKIQHTTIQVEKWPLHHAKLEI